MDQAGVALSVAPLRSALDHWMASEAIVRCEALMLQDGGRKHTHFDAPHGGRLLSVPGQRREEALAQHRPRLNRNPALCATLHR